MKINIKATTKQCPHLSSLNLNQISFAKRNQSNYGNSNNENLSKFNPLNISYLNKVVIEKGINQTHRIILQDLTITYITSYTCLLFSYYLESLAD